MRINRRLNINLLALAVCLSGCAAQQHETVTVEHRGKTMLIHHRSLTAKGARDRIEAVSAKGVVTSATIEVYDVGRMPDGNGGMREAGRFYHIAQSPHWNLNLPSKSSANSTGPKSVYTPPNYSPVPADQRVNDAVAEAKEAKKKLDEDTAKLKAQLAADNALQGQLQEAQSQQQALQDKLAASMNTPKNVSQTDAQKAVDGGAVSDLQKWGQQQAQQQGPQ
jgi:hypothetical protein